MRSSVAVGHGKKSEGRGKKKMRRRRRVKRRRRRRRMKRKRIGWVTRPGRWNSDGTQLVQISQICAMTFFLS